MCEVDICSKIIYICKPLIVSVTICRSQSAWEVITKSWFKRCSEQLFGTRGTVRAQSSHAWIMSVPARSRFVQQEAAHETMGTSFPVLCCCHVQSGARRIGAFQQLPHINYKNGMKNICGGLHALPANRINVVRQQHFSFGRENEAIVPYAIIPGLRDRDSEVSMWYNQQGKTHVVRMERATTHFHICFYLHSTGTEKTCGWFLIVGVLVSLVRIHPIIFSWFVHRRVQTILCLQLC